MTTSQSILTHVLHLNTHNIALTNIYSKSTKDRSQDRRRPSKDRCEPVVTGPVRFWAVSKLGRTGLGLGPVILRSKDRTGPDFQTLSSIACTYKIASLNLVDESPDSIMDCRKYNRLLGCLLWYEYIVITTQ